MEYLLSYLIIGAIVALVMAQIQDRRVGAGQALISSRTMVDVYVFIALAWPIAVTAFVYGALVHALTRSYQREENY